MSTKRIILFALSAIFLALAIFAIVIGFFIETEPGSLLSFTELARTVGSIVAVVSLVASALLARAAIKK